MFDVAVETTIADKDKAAGELPNHALVAKKKIGECHLTGTQITTREGGYKLTSYWAAGPSPVEGHRAELAKKQAEEETKAEAARAEFTAALAAAADPEPGHG